MSLRQNAGSTAWLSQKPALSVLRLSSMEATTSGVFWNANGGRSTWNGGTGTREFAGPQGGRGVRLDDWLDEWLERCANRGLRPTTVASYRTMVRLHAIDELGHIPIARLRPSDLNQLYARLLRNGRRDRGGALSSRTVRYLHTILNRSLADAVRAGHISVNPAQAADPPSAKAARPRVFPVWTPEELARFLKSALDDPHYVAFRLLSATGLRRGELLGLRWADVDSDSRQLHVVQAVVEVDHEARISPPKTERSRRVVALDASTADVLARHREEAQAREPNLDEQALIFANPTGAPIHPALLSYYFQRRVRLSGVRRIRLHDLRHTHATHALQLGVHPKIVSERLGHSTITITLDTYSHVLPSMQREAAEAVAALVNA
jgi:integrase